MNATPGETGELASRTLVASVLFVDIAGYSRLGVTQQVKLKQTFNEVLTAALEHVEPRDRVVIDTGDGAAVAFLDDPERALFAALAIFDNVGELPVRIGINLGPVYLTRDLNGQENVIGDGINVAQRVMSFAQPGQLLVSRSFYDVVLLLSREYATMFEPQDARADKHNRVHEIYAVNQAVRVARRVAETHARLRAQRPRSTGAVDEGPARISDAGTHFIVSGGTQKAVAEALESLAKRGCKVLAAPAQVGARWIATADNPKLAVAATVEQLGMKSIISGPTREAVDAKLRELQGFGAQIVQGVELIDGVWTAVCESQA